MIDLIPEPTKADRHHGYRFGVDGLVSVDDACKFLGNISRDTLDRRANAGHIRKGRNGRRVVICKRSLANYASQLEE